MTPPVQPRQTTRVMAAVQAAQPAHAGDSTGPRYAVGLTMIALAVAFYGWHVGHPAIVLERFDQYVIGFLAVVGFAVLPLAEWALRFVVGLLTAAKNYKNPQLPGQ